MEKMFKSKIDRALPILLVVSSIPGVVTGIKEKDWVAFAISIGVFGLVFYLLYDTNYTISKNNLNVHSGFIVNENIAISEITRIEKTNSILSSPAASLTDRIEVFYGNSKSVIISPKEKQLFIDELLKQNERIKVLV